MTEDPRDRERDRELARIEHQRLLLENQRLSRRVERLEQQLEEVYDSESFRLGRLLLRGPRAARERVARWVRRLRPRPSPSGGAEPRDLGLVLEEDEDQRRAYRAILDRERVRTQPAVAFAVSTTDVSAGRGDLYTALGLARALERLGWQAVCLPPDRWHEPPEGIRAYVAMVAEPDLRLEPARVDTPAPLIAWVRNGTGRWAASGTLGLFDAVWCSSGVTRDRLEEVHPGPLAVVPLGVDADLFATAGGKRQPVAVTTVNQWSEQAPRHLYRCLADAPVGFPLAVYGVQRGLPPRVAERRAGRASYFALPSLYGQVALVLDDQQDVNRRFGNLNGRIYESLACGALPLTNSSRGLEEAGLERLPVYRDGDELRDLVHHHLQNEAARRALVEDLGSVVRERHTWEIRATRVDDLLRELPPASWKRGADRRITMVGFTPDYRATNPYQTMLYARAGRPDRVVAPVRGPEELLATAGRRGVEPVLHVHWTAPILGNATSRSAAERRLERYLAQVDELIDRGGHLVWTIHNAMPHEAPHPDAERRLREGLASRAAIVHALCERTPELLSAEITLPLDRVRVVSHASYVDVYPNLVTRGQARAELGVDHDVFAYLFLGQIRPYKGVDDLLQAFARLRRRDPGSILLVAGQPGRFEGASRLRGRLDQAARVRPFLRPVADEDLQLFLNACDVVVLPYRRVLNSGSLLLAYSFARPVVAPRLGCLPDQVDGRTGILYDPGDPDGLTDALEEARSLEDGAVRRACLDRARAWTYVDMAEAFVTVLDELE